ncbi:hypothetical protein D9615_009836 [Tricholomella constricta]|uniref:Uncharacterized protein n=1 Tax=Tricholomella constricta TaxID=117010 RepID=A0A8H5GX90_9AGAR|nr:hypothetical protein D9615_009836 [Tricholomella constricta]
MNKSGGGVDVWTRWVGDDEAEVEAAAVEGRANPEVQNTNTATEHATRKPDPDQRTPTSFINSPHPTSPHEHPIDCGRDHEPPQQTICQGVGGAESEFGRYDNNTASGPRSTPQHRTRTRTRRPTRNTQAGPGPANANVIHQPTPTSAHPMNTHQLRPRPRTSTKPTNDMPRGGAENKARRP